MMRRAAQYIESIRDGREDYVNGERVADVAVIPEPDGEVSPA